MTALSIHTAFTVDGHRLDGRVPLKAADGHLIPDCAAPRVSDAELQFWGEVFCANNLYAQGVTFETFVTAPYAVLAALERRRCDHYAGTEEVEPLLPRQARVARQVALQTPLGLLDAESDLDLVMRNGTLMEPLHHTRWPRHANRRAES